MGTFTQREQLEIDRANEWDAPPVVFVHGLWLLPSSWDRWRRLFRDAGYATLAPGWPGDPETLEEARRRPEAFAGNGIAGAAAYFAELIGELRTSPALVGHSTGGLLAQKLAGKGIARATVAIDPAPFRGVLPLPWSSLRVSWSALRNPANLRRAVSLPFERFRYAFANAVSDDEAHELYETYAVAAPGRPIFQMATANLHPGTEASVDTKNPARGPLLVISGGKDHTVPPAMATAAFDRQKRNSGITEFRAFEGRGHSLVVDAGCGEVAEVALDFVARHMPGRPAALPREEATR